MTKNKKQKIPDGWRETTLGDVVDIIDGDRGTNYPKNDEMFNDGYCLFLNTKNVPDNRFVFEDISFVTKEKDVVLRKGKLQYGDYVLTTRGTLGNFAYFSEKVPYKNIRINSGMVVLRLTDVIDNSYFRFYLLGNLFQKQVILLQTGSAQPQLPIRDLTTFSILIPVIKEQKAIADVLSFFDDKIELLREQNKTLEAMAQALFKHWFVDFEFPNKNGKPYKSSGGKMVDSELGEIPVGWSVGSLGDEFNIIMGQSPRGNTYNEDGVGTLFFQGRAEFGVRFPKARLYTTEPQRMAGQFDILLSVRAPVGDINVASEDCCIGRGLAAINSKYQSYGLYKVKSLKKWFDMFENEGTVFGSMSGTTFKEISVVIPVEKVIRDFDMFVSQIDVKIFSNYKQIQTLTETRDMLLPKLMRGEVRVKM